MKALEPIFESNFRSFSFKLLRQGSMPVRVTLLLLSLFLGSCTAINLDTSFTSDPKIQASIIDQTSDQYVEVDPLFLSEEIRQLLDDAMGPFDREVERVEKIQEILYGEDHLGITYSDQKTHTAVEAFHAREGNCLSVMNLYVAMARYVGVDANFQTVDVQPNWDRRGDLLVLSQHINATGRFNIQRRYVVDFTPEISLQQLTSSVVSDEEARALYFNNLGVEALIGGDYQGAQQYFKNSLFLDPNQSITWNNIGATFNRLGNPTYAEYSYQKAFDLDRRNTTAINNLAKHYRRSGDTRRARRYEKAMERFNKKNPYYHFAVGSLAYADKDYVAALKAFNRALELKEVEPDFYTAVARIYQDLGFVDEAQYYADSAKEIIALNEEIYVPSTEKVRIIDSNTILRDASPGLSIRVQR
ncbi:MAG: transglutaminase domain-containing protein [Pseudohongiellaceae bacterium]